MEQTKNLCAQIPLALHVQVCEAREAAGQTTAEYITNLLIEYYELKKDGGKTNMANNTRTMAFQIPEDLFQRIKAHLERETQRTGRKLTQREFVLNLIEEALSEAEEAAAGETGRVNTATAADSPAGAADLEETDPEEVDLDEEDVPPEKP